MGSFELRHALVTIEDDDTGEERDVDAVVAQLTHESSVSGVDGFWHGAEVADVVVEGVAVDVVDSATVGNRPDEREVLKPCEVHAATTMRRANRQIARGCFVILFEGEQLEFQFVTVLGEHVVRFWVQPYNVAFDVFWVGLFVAPRHEPRSW